MSIFGQKRYAVRIKVRTELLTQRNLTMEELQAAVRAANANTPVGVLDGSRQTLTIQANRQLRAPASSVPSWWPPAQWRAGSSARRGRRPGQRRDDQGLRDVPGERWITLAVFRQPDANTVKVVDAVKALLPRFPGPDAGFGAGQRR